MFTRTSIWTPGIASLSPNFPQRKPSTASIPVPISVTMTTPMRKMSGRPLGARPWEIIATCTVAPTSCFWQMSLRRSGRCASASTALTPHTTTPARAFHGTPYSKRQEWSSSCSQIMTSTCSSRGGCAEASHWSQSAMPKPTILWSMATTQKCLAAISSTLMRTISMVGP